VATDTAVVTVNNLPPTGVDAGGPYSDVETRPITLTATAADVPADPLTYAWDLDDNGTFDLVGQTVITVWNRAGVYTVTLRVTDDDGGASFDTAQVTISNAPPTADAGGSYAGDEGSPIILTGVGSDPTDDPLTYRWDLDGDGTFERPGQVVTNTWPDDGVYTVTLRVDDGRGGVATDVATVTVNNLPPTGVDAGGPYSGVETQPVTLTATAADVPADPLTYAWDLDNDGTFDLVGQTVITAWNRAGVYTVTLRVTDDDGGASFDTARLIILTASGAPDLDHKVYLPVIFRSSPPACTVDCGFSLKDAP
jgi:hypothetical protein